MRISPQFNCQVTNNHLPKDVEAKSNLRIKISELIRDLNLVLHLISELFMVKGSRYFFSTYYVFDEINFIGSVSNT